MNLEEMNDRLDQIGNAWEHFKTVNDERLKQIEKKGAADPTIMDELEKINNSLDEQKKKMEKLEISVSRPSFESKSGCFEEDLEHKKALSTYLKKGLEANIANLEMKGSLSSGLDSSSAFGGYLLTANMQKIINQDVEDNCFMRKICSVQEISSSALEVLDDTTFATSWINETGTVSDTDVGDFTKTTIKAHELVAQPKVSQKLLDDSFINIEEYLAHRLGIQFAQKEEEAFLKGTGDTDNQPMGITSYTTGIDVIASKATTNGGIKANDIVDLYYSLNEKYVNGAAFVMPREAVSAVRMLKDSTSGAYLWQPALLGGKEDTLMGVPVYQSAYMPALAAESKSIIFGNFKYYQIVDRLGIRILRDPYTAKPYIRFYTTKRVGGDVIRKEAFKILKCGKQSA